jgi:hypothetical protein
MIGSPEGPGGNEPYSRRDERQGDEYDAGLNWSGGNDWRVHNAMCVVRTDV